MLVVSHFVRVRDGIVLRLLCCLLLLGLIACGGSVSRTSLSGTPTSSTPTNPTPTPTPGPAPTPTPTPTPPPSPPSTPPPSPTPSFSNVVVVMLENTSYSDVIGATSMPYLNSLAQKYSLATSYYANTHPSIGNYFMVTTGQIVTNDDTFNGTVSADNVVRELTAAGKTWKSYAESLPAVGYTGGDQGAYLRHHNPMTFFSDVLNSATQQTNLVPFTQFAVDLAAGNLPNYSLVIPNALDDAHDCPAGMSTCTISAKLSAADSWLQTNIGPLIANANFEKSGVLLIAFDEAELTDTTNGGGRVAVVLVSPQLKQAYQSTTLYQHQSLERFTMELLGVTTIPGAGAMAPDMSEFLP